jgi:membrane associated rhomboid family serine protease
VKYLLLINFAVFILQLLFDPGTSPHSIGLLSTYLGVTVRGFWQPWRYLTFQFLHNPYSLWHIGLNMLGLYMLGTPLEQLWGFRRFLRFYLACGACAGLAYVVIGAAGHLPPGLPIIGASGGVYAIVMACAILFPHFRIILIFFPVPIRLAALLIFGAMIFTVLTGLAEGQVNATMSDVAHLGGAVAAAVWILVIPRIAGLRQGAATRRRQGAWQRKMDHARGEQEQVDRILDKIRQHGINSLSGRERRMLQDATHRQQQDENRPFGS